MASTIQVAGPGFSTTAVVNDDEQLTAALDRVGVNCQSDNGQPLSIQVNGTPYVEGTPVPNGAQVSVTAPKLSHG
jgi:hypothetical protein